MMKINHREVKYNYNNYINKFNDEKINNLLNNIINNYIFF